MTKLSVMLVLLAGCYGYSETEMQMLRDKNHQTEGSLDELANAYADKSAKVQDLEAENARLKDELGNCQTPRPPAAPESQPAPAMH